MPAVATLIIQGILAAISAAPQVAAIVTAGKNMIASLVEGKIIDAATQDALHAYVDAHALLVAKGITPPAWTVEPDPTPAELAAS